MPAIKGKVLSAIVIAVLGVLLCPAFAMAVSADGSDEAGALAPGQAPDAVGMGGEAGAPVPDSAVADAVGAIKAVIDAAAAGDVDAPAVAGAASDGDVAGAAETADGAGAANNAETASGAEAAVLAGAADGAEAAGEAEAANDMEAASDADALAVELLDEVGSQKDGMEAAEGDSGAVAMWRLYNPWSGEHFYTSSAEECCAVVAVGWSFEGVGWIAPERSNVPVYRLYNPYAAEHHYTMHAAERDSMVEAGWYYEGIGWYSDDAKTVPLFREYNPYAFANNHNYTTNPDEHAMLVSLGWVDEGYAWYGSDSDSSVSYGLHTVKFDSAGGTPVGAQIALGSVTTVYEPANPTRQGYTFTGWELNGQPYDFSAQVTEDITLTATWEEIYNPFYLSVNNRTDSAFAADNDVERDIAEQYGWGAQRETGPFTRAFSEAPVYRVYHDTYSDVYDIVDGTVYEKVYSGVRRDYYYTTDTAKRNGKVESGWVDDGIGFYSAEEDGVPVHGVVSPYSGAVHYTWDAGELAYLVNTMGWTDDGIAWYGKKGELDSIEPSDYMKTSIVGTTIDFDENAYERRVSGNSDESAVKLLFGGKEVDVTYDVEYTTSPGTVTVAVTGTGAYCGTMAKTFNLKGNIVYRLHYKTSGWHFYTASEAECCDFVADGWTYEGVGWYTPKAGDPVYRVHNPYTGEYYYSSDPQEVGGLVAVGWVHEGVAFYSDPDEAVPVYRIYDPRSGMHYFTADEAEANEAESAGCEKRGVDWYGTATGPEVTNLHTVTFDSVGGTPVNDRIVLGSVTTVEKPVNPTRDGSTFTGWELDGEPYDFSAQVTEDITLTATWDVLVNPLYLSVNDRTDAAFATASTPERNSADRYGWNPLRELGAFVLGFSGVPVYRVYNDVYSEAYHIYSNVYRSVYDGVSGDVYGVYNSVYSDVYSDVYRSAVFQRVYSDVRRDYYYTTDPVDRDSKVEAGWVDDGIGFYSSDEDGVPVHGVVSPYSGARHYTWDKGELDYLVNTMGWADDGVVWYGEKVDTAPITPDKYMRTSIVGTTIGFDEDVYAQQASQKTTEPAVWLLYEGKKVDADFNVAYSKDEQAGLLTVSAIGKGAYSGSVTKTIKLKGEEAATYTVAFDSAEGSAVESQKIAEGQAATKPISPTRAGYTFTGWQLDGASYDFASPVTSDITLRATWEKAKEASYTTTDSSWVEEVVASVEGGTDLEMEEQKVDKDKASDSAKEAWASSEAKGATAILCFDVKLFVTDADGNQLAQLTEGLKIQVQLMVGMAYNGKTVKVTQIHNGKAIDHPEARSVVNGYVTLDVTQLSEFVVAVESDAAAEGGKSSESTTPAANTGKGASDAGSVSSNPGKVPTDDNDNGSANDQAADVEDAQADDGQPSGGNVPASDPEGGSSESEQAAPVATEEMHRLYNPYTGEHFYTADKDERDELVPLGWEYEGVGWIAPKRSNTPVFRMYNPYAGEHHYCMTEEERDALTGAGWEYEGIGWYSDDEKRTPLYREYNPYMLSYNHNYTTDSDEHAFLVSVGWVDEGYAWYGA